MNAVLKYLVTNRPDLTDQLLTNSGQLEYQVNGQWVRYAAAGLGTTGKGLFSVDWSKISDVRIMKDGDKAQPMVKKPRALGAPVKAPDDPPKPPKADKKWWA